MAITITEAKTLLENLKKDISDVSDATFINWCNNINNFAYKIMCGVDPERFISTSTVSVVSGTSTYALPATFKSIDYQGCGVFDLDGNSQPVDTARLPLTGAGSSTVGYYISGSNLCITPQPSASDTYTLRFIPSLTQLTSTSDSLCIPDEYEEYVTRALDVQYCIWDEDKNSEVFADARFQRALSEFAKDVKKAPFTASLPNISNY